MKVFGHALRTCNAAGLVELSEVTFQASPNVLREVSVFLSQMADEMERSPEAFGHRHMQDEVRGWSDSVPERADVIVCC